MAVILSSFCLTGLVITIITYILFHYLRKIRLYIEAAKFPGPPAYPFIGSAHLFIGDTQGILSKCQELLDKYPSPFRVWLANRLFYAIYDPEQIKTVLLSQKTIEKEELYKFAEPWMGTGLFTAPAFKWRIHRKLIMPTFNQRILDSFVEVFFAKSEVLVKEMEVELDGEEFDVFNYMSLCTLDIICETAMGVPSQAQSERSSPYIDAAKRLMEIIYSRMFKIWLHPEIIFNQTKLGKDHRRCIQFVHSLTDNVIKRKKLELQLNENRQDYNERHRKAFLDLLMDLSHEGKSFTDEELREEVDTMMLAGNDTSATVMSFVILMLAIHPDVQTKVFEELCDIYGRNDPSDIPIKQEDLHRMEYLERVIKETMRLFPVGPLIFRRVTDNLNIGEHILTKGSSVVIAIIKTQRSEEYWTEPLKFNPDRFLPEESAKRHPYCYIPFSAGPRNCIGVKYAMMAMKTLLAAIIRKYVLKKNKRLTIEQIKIKADIIIKPAVPITVQIERRMHKKNM